jgi:hypothetical protein
VKKKRKSTAKKKPTISKKKKIQNRKKNSVSKGKPTARGKSRGKSPPKRTPAARPKRAARKEKKSARKSGGSRKTRKPLEEIVRIPRAKRPPTRAERGYEFVSPESGSGFEFGDDTDDGIDDDEMEELEEEIEYDDDDDEMDYEDEDEERDEAIFREIEISDESDIPLVLDQSGDLEIDFEAFGELDPDDISEASWGELLGEDFDFDDMIDFYDEGDIYEFELAISYGEAA